MAFNEISREAFDILNIDRKGVLPEKAWFKSDELDVAGTIVKDPVDRDWAFVLVAKEQDGVYRFLDNKVSLRTRKEAQDLMFAAVDRLEAAGTYEEGLYEKEVADSGEAETIVITSIDEEVKRYLKKHPEKLYEISPRKFEELVASILKDMGFEVELTQATRDGGRDIIAHVRNAVTSFLTHIECKRYAADNKVGVGIIREVLGVHHLRQATKSIIVTTSFFSADAIKEASRVENQLDLRDFNHIKGWLQQY